MLGRIIKYVNALQQKAWLECMRNGYVGTYRSWWGWGNGRWLSGDIMDNSRIVVRTTVVIPMWGREVLYNIFGEGNGAL